MYWGNTYKYNVINDVEFTQRRKEQNITPVDFILLTDECIIFLKYFHQRPAKCIIAEQRYPLRRKPFPTKLKSRAEQPCGWLKEREAHRHRCTANDTRGCAAALTVRRLLGWTFPITTEGWGPGARLAPDSSRAKDPAVLAGAPGDPLLPQGFSRALLLASSCVGSRVAVDIIAPPLCRRRGGLGGPQGNKSRQQLRL